MGLRASAETGYPGTPMQSTVSDGLPDRIAPNPIPRDPEAGPMARSGVHGFPNRRK